MRSILEIDTILVPTDGSKYSLRAAEYAAGIAEKFDSEVHLLHVMGTRPSTGSTTRVERAAREILDRTKEVLVRAGLNELDVVVREPVYGHPAETICNVSEREKFDLVVMGSRGLSEIRAFFMGDVADKVSHHAACSVLIVR